MNSLNKRLEKDYYSNKLQGNFGNIKQAWKTVNEIVNKTSKTTKRVSIKVNHKLVTDKVISNIMNTHFSSVGECFKDKIPYEQNPVAADIHIRYINIYIASKNISHRLTF